MFKKITAVCLMAATSISPAMAQRVGADGYHWSKPEFTKSSVEIRVILFKSRKELTEQYNAMGGEVKKMPWMEKTPKLNAFSGFNRTRQTCDIFAIDPAVEYHPEDFGHELLHCFFGDWHSYMNQ